MGLTTQEKELADKLARFLKTRSPIAKAIQRVRAGMWQSYLFGGVLRDIFRPDPLVPGVRDVDFVINDEDFNRFHWHLRAFVVSRNRFGGLRLRIGRVPVDAWSLKQTWAFRQGFVAVRSFRSLTETTFLNIDGIVADISYARRGSPEVYARGYLAAFKNNVLDIELRENPFPSLVAVKALRAMYRYKLGINRPLADYISWVLENVGFEKFESEQRRHYGRALVSGERLSLLAASLQRYLRYSSDEVYSPFAQKDLPGFDRIFLSKRVALNNRYNYAD